MEVLPGVWRTGSNSVDTAGGNAFVVQRPDGNVLIDGPRFTARLQRSIAKLGGLRRILLTHADDVGDAARYAQAFDADVVIHEHDASAAPFATTLLTGLEPASIANGIMAIPTPGHTAGHVMYLLDDHILFSGDSLDYDPDTEQLGAYEEVCWWSWPEQIASLERLTRYRFATVVPTHGGMLSSPIPSADMNRLLRELVDRLRRRPENALDPTIDAE